MRWYDQVLFGTMSLLISATPVSVLYSCSWLHDNRARTGWRIWTSRAGVIYGIFILAAMAALWAAMAIAWGRAEFPYVDRGPRMLARLSLASILFALLGKGRVRLALAITALGGTAFAVMVTVLH